MIALDTSSIVAYLAVAVRLNPTAPALVVNNLFFLLSALTLGFSSNYAIERYARANFLQRRLIALRTLELEEKNAQLVARNRMLAESRAFMRELVTQDLSVTNIVASDFLMMNDRLAEHYRFVGPAGSRIVRVVIPQDCERGGFITQASVLKVTANGTTTSPVIRGIWFNERILGQPVPQPPPGTPAIDPDTHGTTTIREQLEKHRADPACAACHAKLDPAGFAMEGFDVIGGFRHNYRSLGEGTSTTKVFPGGWKPVYKLALPVDSAGQLPDGRAFKDIIDLRKHLLADPDQIARNLTHHLLTYATGAELGYSDRRDVAQIVADSRKHNHGIRNLIHVIAQSELFQRK